MAGCAPLHQERGRGQAALQCRLPGVSGRQRCCGCWACWVLPSQPAVRPPQPPRFLPPTSPTTQVSEHPECRVRLTIQEGSSGKGKAAGHKVKLMAALVLAGTSTEGLSKPGRLASIASR